MDSFTAHLLNLLNPALFEFEIGIFKQLRNHVTVFEPGRVPTGKSKANPLQALEQAANVTYKLQNVISATLYSV